MASDISSLLTVSINPIKYVYTLCSSWFFWLLKLSSTAIFTLCTSWFFLLLKLSSTSIFTLCTSWFFWPPIQDESVDGTPVLTILCNHTFHVNCLAKWGDTRWVKDSWFLLELFINCVDELRNYLWSHFVAIQFALEFINCFNELRSYLWCPFVAVQFVLELFINCLDELRNYLWCPFFVAVQFVVTARLRRRQRTRDVWRAVLRR